MLTFVARAFPHLKGGISLDIYPKRIIDFLNITVRGAVHVYVKCLRDFVCRVRDSPGARTCKNTRGVSHDGAVDLIINSRAR